MVAASELSINDRANANTMAQTIFGEGVTVVRASYTGDRDSSATYTGGDSTSPGVVPGDEGIILSTATHGISPIPAALRTRATRP